MRNRNKLQNMCITWVCLNKINNDTTYCVPTEAILRGEDAVYSPDIDDCEWMEPPTSVPVVDGGSISLVGKIGILIGTVVLLFIFFMTIGKFLCVTRIKDGMRHPKMKRS